MRCRFLIAFTSLFLLNTFAYKVWSQETYLIDQFTLPSDISNDPINCIMQSRDGFMWFGMQVSGLFKFDGSTTESIPYDLFQSEEMIGNEVTFLYEDKDGIIWIGTRHNGLFSLNRNSLKVDRYVKKQFNDSSLIHNTINSIYQDSEERLIISTVSGICIFNHLNNSFKRPSFHVNKRLGFVYQVCEVSPDMIIVATKRNGLFLLNIRSLEIIQQLNRGEINLQTVPGSNIRVMLFDSRKRLWVGTLDKGLFLLKDLEKWEFVNFKNEENNSQSLLDNRIYSIHEDNKKNIWIGTINGLDILQPPEQEKDLPIFTHIQNNGSNIENGTNCLTEDRDGNIWAGTQAGDINYIRTPSANISHLSFNKDNSEGLSNNLVSCFAETEEGIWVGTRGGGLKLFNTDLVKIGQYNNTKDSLNALQSDYINTLYTDSDEDLWIGTDIGLDLLSRSTQMVQKYDLFGSATFCITEGIKHEIWVGTSDGLVRLKKNSSFIERYRRISNDSTSISHNSIRSILKDTEDNIWIGTRRGMNKYNIINNSFHRIYFTTESDSGGSNYITDIIEYEPGIILLGTMQGIIVFDTREEEFFSITEKDGLTGTTVHSINMDVYNHIWVTTNKGISRIYPSQFLLDNTNSLDFIVRKFNEIVHESGMVARDNRLFLEREDGFDVVSINPMYDQSIFPEIIITDIKLNNISIEKESSLIDEISLTHKQSAITFEFTVIEFDAPEHINISYYLQGFDKSWYDIQDKRDVTFTNLKPGDYEFRLKSTNNKGIWNKQYKSIKVKILPPWWKAKFAFIVYIGLIVYVLYVFNLRITKRINERNQLEVAFKEDQRMKEINEMKMDFITSISQEFRTPISLIMAPLERIRNDKNISTREQNYLHRLINGNVLRLQGLIDQVVDLKKLETGELSLEIYQGNLRQLIERRVNWFKTDNNLIYSELRFKWDVNKKAEFWFDRYIVDNIVFTLLSSINPKNSITIELTYTKPFAILKMEYHSPSLSPQNDDFGYNKFIDSEDRLSMVKSLIEFHKGKIVFESKGKTEKSCWIYIPVDKDQFHSSEIVEIGKDMENQRYPILIENPIETESMDKTVTDKDDAIVSSILIVEDNFELRKFIRNSFKIFKIYEAENGEIGYRLAKEHIPDIIISDIMMPVMDGIQFCNKIRFDNETNHIPIILLTAKTSLKDKLYGANSGANIYIEKPFNLAFLHANVANLLNQSNKMRERLTVQESNKELDKDEKLNEDEFLSKAMEIILKQKSNINFSVEHLSQELGISRSHLYRKFIELTKHSPQEYIKVVRLKHARELMFSGEFNINEITYECGFSSASYFIASFKKYYNQTPKQFALIIEEERNKGRKNA